MSVLSSIRESMDSKVDETVLQNENVNDADLEEYLSDETFMQECMGACMPTMLQMMLMDESADALDENVKNAFVTVQDYLVGQGIISEASAVHINNPRINVVHLSKQAQINRLTSIITLKMGRKANHKAYKKYKLGQQIKKKNIEELRKLFGAKAERLAKKLWQKSQKSAKVNATVEANKVKSKLK